MKNINPIPSCKPSNSKKHHFTKKKDLQEVALPPPRDKKCKTKARSPLSNESKLCYDLKRGKNILYLYKTLTLKLK